MTTFGIQKKPPIGGLHWEKRRNRGGFWVEILRNFRLGGLADSTGQPLRVPDLLKNVKLIGSSQIPNNLTVGGSADCSEIFLGDFSQMAFAIRENVSVQLLRELYAATGEVGFACHVRADVAVRYPAAFCKVTGVR